MEMMSDFSTIMEKCAIAKVITFDMFSMMVDEALEQMRTMLDSNEAVQKLIANEAGEGSE